MLTRIPNAGPMAKKLSAVSRHLAREIGFKILRPKVTLEPRDALVICADPRGGSTWLTELLSAIPGVSIVWEPLDVGRVQLFRDLGFNYRQYIPEDGEAPEAFRAFDNLFRGRCRDHHLMQRTSPCAMRDASRLLVKFCRATQLLPWMVRQFNFNQRPIHLLRHPCAVVASQIKYGAWADVDPEFCEEEVCRDPLLRPYADLLLSIKTIEERLAAFWAVANKVALDSRSRERGWITIHYEHLVLDSRTALAEVSDDWQVDLDSLSSRMGAPSATTLSSSPITRGAVRKQLEYWKSSLDECQTTRILDTVGAIGVSEYSRRIYPDS